MEPHKIIDNDDFQDGFCRWWFPHSIKKNPGHCSIYLALANHQNGAPLGSDHHLMAATWAEICWFTIPSSKPAMVWPVLIIDKDLKMCTICVYICIYIYIYIYMYVYIYICVCVDRTKVISHIQYYMLGRSIDGWIGGSMDRRLDGSIDIYLWPVAGSSQVGTRGHKGTNHKDLGSKDYSADMRIWMGIHVWIRFFMWGICIYIYIHIHT